MDFVLRSRNTSTEESKRRKRGGVSLKNRFRLKGRWGRPEPEENPSAWGWLVLPERGCAESQPQPPAQCNAPQVTRQVCWLATSLRLVFDTAAPRQRGFALP